MVKAEVLVTEDEDGEYGGYLMKEQNDYLHNGDGENVASLKLCIQEVTHQILPQECLPLATKGNQRDWGAQWQRC